jgi:ubiquinone/menaquinone biosynthesis C-methylase UbiE
MSAEKSQQVDILELQNSNPIEYEKKYVHDVYDKISLHFSSTRYRQWPLVKQFLISLPKDSILVDVGCGNGKNLGVSPGISFGCDICYNLLEIAKSKGHNVVQCDALNTPYKDSFADFVISIAVIHHFATVDRRILAIKEMLRIVKSGGLIMIYVWAEPNASKKHIASLDEHIPQLKHHATLDSLNSSQLNCHDCFVAWKNQNENNKKYERYYHFFDKGELENLCLASGNCTIEKSYFDTENWAVIIKKI